MLNTQTLTNNLANNMNLTKKIVSIRAHSTYNSDYECSLSDHDGILLNLNNNRE